MFIYSVTGELPYTTYCPCEYCDGHTARKKVDELVEATSERAAMIHAARNSDIDDFDELAGYLTVTEAPPDQVMQRMGMPTLFELEPAP